MPRIATLQEWLQGLSDPDPEIRHASTIAIGGLSPADEVPIDAFIQALDSANETLVFWSVTGLACLGSRSASAIPKLANLAQKHPAFGVRQCALYALSKIGPSAPEAKLAFLDGLADDNAFVRRQALHSCIAIPVLGEADLARISALASDPDQTVATWSEVTLRNIRLRSNQGHAP